MYADQPCADGVSIVSDFFRDTDTPDDYDAVFEAFIDVWKKPDEMRIANSYNLHCYQYLYKETIIEENAEGDEFEVMHILDADRLASFGMSSGDKQDKVVMHQRVVCNYDGRAVTVHGTKDHWRSEKPEMDHNFVVSFCDPLRIDAYFVRISDGRVSRDAGPWATSILSHFFREVNFELRRSRRPETKLKWDRDRMCYHTGQLGELSDYDSLFDRLLIVIRGSCGPVPGQDVPGIVHKQYSEDHAALVFVESQNTVLEWSCVHNKDEGTILRTCNSLVWPNIMFNISKSPLCIKVYHKQKDNITDMQEEHLFGRKWAQTWIDSAFEQILGGLFSGAACCGTRAFG